MSSSSVWVQLYYKGKDEPNGQPVKIKATPEDVADLKAAVLPKLDPAELTEVFVYPAGTTPTFSPDESLDPGGLVVAEMATELTHCSAGMIRVYPPETSPPFSQAEPLKSWDPIPPSSGPKPLIVVAPAPQQQQQTLQAQQDQPHPLGDDDDNILGRGVYEKLTGSVCFFSDEGNKPIGAGFAISKTTVYSVAHNFPHASKGMEISCRFGRPNNHVIRQLHISGLDNRLDYCILKTVKGEAPMPDFLEISRAPLRPGKNCILAAFQIGIQKDLKDLDPDLSVGVFKGEISKLYPRHFVYQCPSFAGDSGGAVVLKDGKVVGIHQETVIQARERIQHGEDLDADARLESVEASIDELLSSLSSGSIGLQLSAIPQHEQ